MAYQMFNNSMYQQLIYYKGTNSKSYFHYGNPFCTSQKIKLSDLTEYKPMYTPKMKDLNEIESKSDLNPFARSFFNFDKYQSESIE